MVIPLLANQDLTPMLVTYPYSSSLWDQAVGGAAVANFQKFHHLFHFLAPLNKGLCMKLNPPLRHFSKNI